METWTTAEFRDIAQGFQAIFITLASIIAGVWVLLRFGITRERTRAQYELERLRVETQRMRGVSCELSIRHEQVEPHRALVYADVTLLNHGTDIVVYRCDDFPFHINRVTIRNAELWFDEVVRLRIEDATAEHGLQVRWPVTLSILPETPHRLSFHYQLDSPGSYMFSLILGSEDLVAKADRDRKELLKRRAIYEQYKDHPQYQPDPKAEAVFTKHYFVGERQAGQTPPVAPDSRPQRPSV